MEPESTASRAHPPPRRLRNLVTWDTAVGLVLGAALTWAALIVVHELEGLRNVSRWERIAESRHHAAVRDAMLAAIDSADAALADGAPFAMSADLTTAVLPRVIEHVNDYLHILLRDGRVTTFNQIRAAGLAIVVDLEGRDLAGADLTGANLAGVVLSRADLRQVDLTDANLGLADLSLARMGGANLTRTNLERAVLVGAHLEGARGEGCRMVDVQAAGATLFGTTGLTGVDAAGADLSEANLGGVVFADWRLDGADLSNASAVAADFRPVASMADVNLYGAVLGGARFEPRTTPRAWLLRVSGVPPEVLRGLADAGGIVDEPSASRSLDPRVVTGFRAQLENRPDLADAQRRAMLLEMIRVQYQTSSLMPQ